jgi:hypothetical protein
MKTRTPLGQAYYDSTVAAQETDDAFSAALVAQFGKRRAVNRRYSYKRDDWGPALVAAHEAKTAAQEAQQTAFYALLANGETV